MNMITIDRSIVQQALEALEAMNPYPASKEDQRAGALTALRAALAAQGCYITQDITRQEYERLYPDAEEEVK